MDQALVHYYARRAKEYERIFHKPERQADLQKLRALVADVFAGKRVLEVACGTGYWTEILGRSATSVLATDINEEVLAIARSKGLDPARVVFGREDAYLLPIPERQFGAGFSGFWWSHIPKAKIRRFLNGFHRLLEPGATVMFIDNVYVEGSSTPIARRDEQGDSYQRRRLDDGSTHEVLKNFPAEGELRAAVDGLASDVRVEFMKHYWILAYSVQRGG